MVCVSFADGGECKSLHIHTSIDVRTFLVVQPCGEQTLSLGVALCDECWLTTPPCGEQTLSLGVTLCDECWLTTTMR